MLVSLSFPVLIYLYYELRRGLLAIVALLTRLRILSMLPSSGTRVATATRHRTPGRRHQVQLDDGDGDCRMASWAGGEAGKAVGDAEEVVADVITRVSGLQPNIEHLECVAGGCLAVTIGMVRTASWEGAEEEEPVGGAVCQGSGLRHRPTHSRVPCYSFHGGGARCGRSRRAAEGLYIGSGMRVGPSGGGAGGNLEVRQCPEKERRPRKPW